MIIELHNMLRHPNKHACNMTAKNLEYKLIANMKKNLTQSSKHIDLKHHFIRKYMKKRINKDDVCQVISKIQTDIT